MRLRKIYIFKFTLQNNICSELGGRTRQLLPAGMFCVLTHNLFFRHSTCDRYPRYHFCLFILHHWCCLIIRKDVADAYGTRFWHLLLSGLQPPADKIDSLKSFSQFALFSNDLLHNIISAKGEFEFYEGWNNFIVLDSKHAMSNEK